MATITYLEAERNGRKPQALLTAPNPDRTPRTIVPKMMRRDIALVKASRDVRPAGNGMFAKANRKTKTGIKLIIMRMPKNCRRPDTNSILSYPTFSMCRDIPSFDCTPTIKSRLMHCGIRTKIENIRKVREYRQLYNRVL
jgi:hypothetical protein